MRASVMLFCLALVACGGGGGGNSQSSGGLPPVGTVITVEVTIRDEIEPNDSLALADAHTLPTHGANADYVGFGVIGDVNDTDDSADYFIFTASRAHVFTVQMCEFVAIGVPPCSPLGASEIIDTSIAYFEVLDQNGVLLLSSQGDVALGNFQEISIDAGIPYYLAVFAEDTVGVAESYQIEMIEKIPLP